MSRLARYLAARMVVRTALACAVGGLLTWAAAAAETRVAWGIGAGGALWLFVGGALLLAPVAVLAALIWSCMRLISGPLDLLSSSGVARPRVATLLGRGGLGLLLAAAVALELCLPSARDVLAPLVAWEKKSPTPVVWVVGEARIATRFGARWSRLTEAWTWTQGLPAHYVDVEYDGRAWVEKSSGRTLAALPAPGALLAERPYLYELMTTPELLELGLGGPAGVVAIERALRPWFWWLWFTALARLLLGRRRTLARTLTGALAWVMLGVSLLVAARVGVATLSPAVLLLPIAAGVAVNRRRLAFLAERHSV